MKLQTMEQLFVHELQDLHNAEKQLTKALPKMADSASHQSLKTIFSEHLKETEQHLQRLEDALSELGHKPTGKVCEAMRGIIEEGKEVLDADAQPDVHDAALIGAAQRAEHYEIAGYGTAVTYAKRLGHTKIAEILSQTLQEEHEADQKLTRVAEGEINIEAVQAG